MSGIVFDKGDKPLILVIEARYYEQINDSLARGAIQALDAAGADYERVSVPGALEIPAAIGFATQALAARDATSKPRIYDGFVTLGCVIRGETSHYDLVCRECSRGVMKIAEEKSLAIGFGVLTVENKDQAMARADVDRGNAGGRAARACLQMIDLKRKFRVSS